MWCFVQCSDLMKSLEKKAQVQSKTSQLDNTTGKKSEDTQTRVQMSTVEAFDKKYYEYFQ